VKAGDAFLVVNEYKVKHLYVIVSDPEQNAEEVYLVMVSSHETHKDETCILEAGDHLRITHRSVVVYQRPPAVITSVSRLKSQVENKSIVTQPPVSESVLTKIRQGCTKSDFVPPRIETLLFKQGLLQY
jgi:hypothetical protein